eukprot:1143257-Pelagomonas_calceolata.AAC.4
MGRAQGVGRKTNSRAGKGCLPCQQAADGCRVQGRLSAELSLGCEAGAWVLGSQSLPWMFWPCNCLFCASCCAALCFSQAGVLMSSLEDARVLRCQQAWQAIVMPHFPPSAIDHDNLVYSGDRGPRATTSACIRACGMLKTSALDVLVPATFQLGTDADKRISSKYTPIKGNQAPLAATDLMFRATEGAAHDSQGTDSQAAGFVARGGYDDGAGDGGDLRAVDQDAAAAYQRYNPLHAPASGPGGGLLKKPCKHVLSSA